MNKRDLFIRFFVILITSLVLSFLTKKNQFDLHFKIRKTQPLSTQIRQVVPGENSNGQALVTELLSRKAEHIIINHFEFDKASEKVTPFTSLEKNPKYLSLQIKPDFDGILRRTRLLNNPIDQLKQNSSHQKTHTINFRGPRESFESFTETDFLQSHQDLSGLIIVVSQKESPPSVTTPVGLMTETELITTIIDNALEKRFIPDGKIWTQVLCLLFTLIVITLILLFLPSTLALLSTFLFCIFYVSLSLWLFDNFFFWTPILSPLVQALLTFLLISNYKYVLNEKTKWNLEKESLFFAEMEEMKTNFLSLFSHDLKTPLAKIIGISETLISQVDNPEIKELLEKIHLSSKDLEKYIKRILKMSQVQSKNTQLNKFPTDLNKLIEKSMEQNKLLASEKEIHLEKKLHPLFMVELDGPLIQEVIINFIENAIKYSPRGSSILIQSEESKDHIKVTVTDQGPGIPKEAQENIWEKYYRFDSETSGYGLGLFLSRYVINLHKGQVFLRSESNKGSQFGFLIPFNEES